MQFHSTRTLVAAACLAGLMCASGVSAEDCAKPPRQPATDRLIALVNSDTNLKYDLSQSIAMGQVVNSDPMTNPVASLEDYYDFVDALVTYNPQNIKTGVFNGPIRVSRLLRPARHGGLAVRADPASAGDRHTRAWHRDRHADGHGAGFGHRAA